MSKRQALNRFSGVAIVLLPIIIAWGVLTDLRTMQATNRLIARQDAVVDSLRAERRALKKQVRDAGKEIKELPEEAQLGRAVDSGWKIAKRQENIEGRITRNRNKTKTLEATRAEVRGHLMRSTVPPIIIWGVLGLVFWRTRRSATQPGER